MNSELNSFFEELSDLTSKARNSRRLTVAEILSLWDLKLEELAHVDLSLEDLSDEVLDGANLFDANLSYATLCGASFIGTNLQHANLTQCNLIRANLSGANLAGANLGGAKLERAILRGANLNSANLKKISYDDNTFLGSIVSKKWADEQRFSYRYTGTSGAVEVVVPDSIAKRAHDTWRVFDLGTRFKYKHGGIIKEASEIPGPSNARSIDVSQPFDYLFPDLARDADSILPADDPASTIAQLNELGEAMADDDSPMDNSVVAPVYTYLGQFIDHDITVTVIDEGAFADITDDFTPVSPDDVIGLVTNGRRAILDLDCVYGDGPTFPGESPETEAQRIGMFDGPKMKMGMITVDDGSGSIPGAFISPVGDLKRDLPRGDDREPLIGDSRNDENTLVSQLHTGFLRFHNALVDALDSGSIAPPTLDTPADKPTKGYYDDAPGGHQGGCRQAPSGDRALFEQASTLARRHYQWIVVNDFLKTIGRASVVDDILENGPSTYKPAGPFPFMPFEHSVAAYRFGHSMVRHEYDFNRNFNPSFGQADSSAVSRATFDQLFVFTGKGGFRGALTLPFNWVVEWDRLVDTSVQSARKIDTRLASDLANMTNEVSAPPQSELPLDVQALLKHLARRNLLRSYLFSVPTGQAMAAKLGFCPLSADEMKSGNSAELNRLLTDSGFLERTPAWYYILKEAEVREEGNTLGELGTAIVAETFIGLLKADGKSILNEASGWTPADGADVGTIAELLSFAGVLDRDVPPVRMNFKAAPV